jgi:hypothetical protein
MRAMLARKSVAWLLAAALAVTVARPVRADAADTAPYGSSPEAWRLMAAQREYEAQKKNAWAAFGLELVLPGLGNVYVGEREEALLEWFGLLVGTLFLLDGRGVTCGSVFVGAGCPTSASKTGIGIVLITGSWLFGVTTAPLNAERNNAALRARLGLDAAGPSWSATPRLLALPGGAGAGLHLTF